MYFMCWSSVKMIRTLATTATAGITRLTRMISKDFDKQFVLTLLELVDNGVVKGVLVLLKPSSDVVADLFDDETEELEPRAKSMDTMTGAMF